MRAYLERAAVLAAFFYVAFGVLDGGWTGYLIIGVPIAMGLVLAYLEYRWGRLIPSGIKRRLAKPS